MTAMNAAHFHDDDKARQYLEAVRWPSAPVCPHCGVVGGHYALKGKAHRPRLYKCHVKGCRKQFSVTVGTVFERSKIPLSKWLMAAYLLCSSKKGMSAHQLHRVMGVTYKTAWFLAHRIRHAMETQPAGLLGSGGQVVEGDETHIGRKRQRKVRASCGHKHAVFSLIERKTGQVRSAHVPQGRIFDGIKRPLNRNVSSNARLATDEAKMYPGGRQALCGAPDRQPQEPRVEAWRRLYQHP